MFGPFRVLHQIGVGVLGPVFRAYDPSRDRPFIVKELRIDVAPEQARLLVEAFERLAAGGSFHPAVAVPVAAGLEDGTPYLVLEHIGGESLDLAARRYAAAEVRTTLSLLDVLADALDAAHGRGVLHGALHLRDVFVAADLPPRVTGFGIVPALAQVGLRVPLRRPYAAPELIAGQDWGPPADRFALAAIACELLTGRRLAGTGAQVGARLGTIERIPDSEALQAVFAAALAEAPERRPASAGRFTAQLRAALGKPAERSAARSAVPVRSREERRDAGLPVPLASAAGADKADEIVDRPASAVSAPVDTATPRRANRAVGSDIFEFEDGEPEDTTRDDHDRSADAPGALPAMPAAVAGATDRPWWWSAAQVTLAVLLILAAAAAYRAGLRLGGDVTPADGGALVGEPPAQAAPVAAESAASRWTATPAPVPSTAQGEPATEASAAPALVADSADPATAAPGLEPEAAPVSPLAEAPAVVPAAAEGTGWVLVRTTTPGARVTMGGADRGLTPLSISDVPFGSLEVRVHRDGYEPETRQVVLSSAQPVAAVGLQLTPLAAAAALDRGGAR